MKIRKIDAQPQEIKKLRVAAYCRVSTDSDDQKESLDTQKKHYESWIKMHSNWEFAGVFYDFGISGTKADARDGLQALLYECRISRIDYILTKSISRFSRNTTDCLSLVRELLSYNIPIYFEKENLDTGSMESELILAILSSMAQGESESISENVKWSNQKNIENGIYKFSYLPYGYMHDKNGDMIINSDEADVIKDIFRYALNGVGTYKIAKLLQEQGVPTRRGGQWTGSTVKSILTNEKYYGAAIFNKTYTDSNFKRHKNNGESDRYYAEEHHEAIISKSEFEKVQELIQIHADERKIIKSDSKYLKRYPFSGLIVCGECGSKFKRQTQSSGVAWACKTHLFHKEQCSIKFIKEEAIKAALTTMMNKLIFGYKRVLKPYLESIKLVKTDDNLQRILNLKENIQKNSDRKNDIRKLRVKGLIDSTLFNQEVSRIEKQNEEYRMELRQLDNSKNDHMIKETEKLIHFIESSNTFSAFDESFLEYLDCIIVYSRTFIGFKLKCGLTLKEEICTGTK